jgi:hypothetical protein
MIFLKRFKCYVAVYINDLPIIHDLVYGCSAVSGSKGGISAWHSEYTDTTRIVLKERYVYEYVDKSTSERDRLGVVYKIRRITFKITDRRFMTVKEDIDDPESYDQPNEYYEDGAVVRKLNLLQHIMQYLQQLKPYKTAPEFSSKLCLHKKCSCDI